MTFSGDKVLGGPQAGILVGRRSLIERCKKNQLTRALRADKLCLSGLEATLRVYLDPERARREIPTVRRIVLDETTLFALAKRLSEALNKVLGPKWSTVEHGGSRVGGGAFPEYELKTFLVRLAVRGGASAQALKRELLAGDPPLICRLEHDALFLDPRTLEEEDYPLLVRVVRQALERIERNASVECAASAGDA